MNIINIKLGVDTQPCSAITLGRRGENEVTQVVVDFSSWVEEFGAGVITLLAMRSRDSSAYPIVLTLDGSTATWDVTSTDTAFKGSGRAEFIYTIGEQIAKSVVFNTVVMQDIGEPSETPPDPYEEWLERLTELGAETQANAEAAQTSAEDAERSAQEAAQEAANAEGYAEQAGESASAAQSAEAASEAARDAAQTAQARAEASATAASGSAASAAGSATAAAGSASDASASASAAGASATAASASATTASNAATAAQTAQSAAEDAAEDAQQAAQQAHVEYEQLSGEVDDLSDEVAQQKSAFEAHEQYAEETYAKQDGSYEDLTAGNAYELLSDRGDTNQQPYLFRQTGGDSSAYNREQLKKIVGGTAAWNQLMQNGNFVATTGWSPVMGSLSADNNELTYTVSEIGGYYFSNQVAKYNLNIPKDHVIILSCETYAPNTNGFYMSVRTNQVGQSGVGITNVTPTANAWNKFSKVTKAVNQVTDIAFYWSMNINYQIGNEVKLRNVFVCDLTQMFGTAIADYIYSLEQATAGAGVAFFRSLFPADYYDYNPGELMSVEGVSAHIMRDADNNIVGSYPLDSSLTLRGIPKLDSNNRLYYDGDTYEPDGTVNRRYGIVDMGTLGWTGYSASLKRAYAPLPGVKYGPASVVRNILPSALLHAVSVSYFDSHTEEDAQVCVNNTNEVLWVRLLSAASASDYASMLSGVYLIYELATPTTETAEPYRELEICDRDGTEEFVSTSIVPVGHETFYPVNVFDYIDRLTEPDADMIADSAIAANKYFSVGNRLFLSTASIASGAQIIPGTNCTETSLAAALNALNA